MAQNGLTLKDAWETMFTEQERAKYGGEFSLENYDNYMKGEFYVGMQDFAPGEANCYTIDNNDYSDAGIRHLRSLIGLTGDFTYDQKALEDI